MNDETHPFSESNIHSAVQALKAVVCDGLVRTNEKIYDLRACCLLAFLGPRFARSCICPHFAWLGVGVSPD